MDEKGWDAKIGTNYDIPKNPLGFLEFFKRLQTKSKEKLSPHEIPVKLQSKYRHEQTPLRLPRNQL